jgi:hypothetical protein
MTLKERQIQGQSKRFPSTSLSLSCPHFLPHIDLGIKKLPRRPQLIQTSHQEKKNRSSLCVSQSIKEHSSGKELEKFTLSQWLGHIEVDIIIKREVIYKWYSVMRLSSLNTEYISKYFLITVLLLLLAFTQSISQNTTKFIQTPFLSFLHMNFHLVAQIWTNCFLGLLRSYHSGNVL